MKSWKRSGRAQVIVAAAAVGVFASLGGVGYAAGLVHFAHSSATGAQYPPSKVTICHHTHSHKNPFVTITVSVHALPAHLGHGDTIGACSQGATGPTGVQGHLPAKVIVAKHVNHGQHGDKSHGHSAKGPAGKGGHGSQGHGQSKSHGQGHGKGNSQSKSHGQGHGKGHGQSKGHGHGHGQGQNHGQGHGQGQGHGSGGGNGNSGGGKGNGHNP